MKMLLVGAGGVGESILKILQKRDPKGEWLKLVIVSDYDLARAKEVVGHLGETGRFIPEKINAKHKDDIAAYEAGARYANMGTWSAPYSNPKYGYGLENSFEEIMTDYNFKNHEKWKEKGLLGSTRSK